MGCTVRRNRHGYLAWRLRFDGRQSHEGTALLDTPENRRRVEDRARVIDQEIRDGTFDYLHWFPTGNLADAIRGREIKQAPARRITLRSFFDRWADDSTGAATAVSAKWRSNRVSAVRSNVLPTLGHVCLDELRAMDLVALQRVLLERGLAKTSVDNVVHSALRSMLKAARVAGFRVPDIRQLYDRDFVRRLASGQELDIDPYTGDERDAILEYFRTQRAHYRAFVFFRFWTGTRPSEAIGLRWGDVDFGRRVARIRRSRVLGKDGETKTRKSRREVVLHDVVIEVLHDLKPLLPDHDTFVFTTPSGTPIDEVNFQSREWRRALAALKIRPRPFYSTRHTYISEMLDLGARPLWVAKQTGTSLEMIEKHYGRARDAADELDRLIGEREHVKTKGNPGGTLSGTEPSNGSETDAETTKAPDLPGLSHRAGDRDRTGDVQLGKLAFYR